MTIDDLITAITRLREQASGTTPVLIPLYPDAGSYQPITDVVTRDVSDDDGDYWIGSVGEILETAVIVR